MRQAPGLRPGDGASFHLADGELFRAAIEAMVAGLARGGRLLGLDRRHTQRLVRGERGLPPDDWLELAGRLEDAADRIEAEADSASEAAWTARKRMVARLIREGVAGAVPGPTAVFGTVGTPSAVPGAVAVNSAGVTPERVIARTPLVGTHEHATVERRPDGTCGWRLGAEGDLSGRYEYAEDAFAALAELVGEGCRPRARGTDLDDMQATCMHHDNREMGR